MERYVRSFLIVMGLLLIQITFLPLISIEGIVPDILLIWVVYNAVRRGQTEGMVAGFVVGLLQDFASTSFFGLAALSKTIAGFLAGYFFNENKIPQLLGTYRFLLIIAICSFAQNIFYFLILFQGSEHFSVSFVLLQSVLTMTYTASVGAFPMFAFSRRQFA